MSVETPVSPRRLPEPRIAVAPYRRADPPEGALRLDGNEGHYPDPELVAAVRRRLAKAPEKLLRSYPSTDPLAGRLAELHGADPQRVVVTAGVDDALARICQAYLGPGRRLVAPVPTFGMMLRYAELSGATIREIEWTPGPYPIDAVIDALDETTKVVAVVSPNNPTGSIILEADFERLIRATEGRAIVLFDRVYYRYVDPDLGDDRLDEIALEAEHVVALYSLSKADGLAGCRVGWAVAAPPVADALRSAGNPYPVSSLSLVVADAYLEADPEPIARHTERIAVERRFLAERFRADGVEAPTSQANFLYAGFGRRADLTFGALRTRGVVVRRFADPAVEPGRLRITLPGTENGFDQLNDALDWALDPQALLFDLDGVLADVRDSYDRCVEQTVRSFGVELDPVTIAAGRLAEGANDDWVLTRRLLRESGVDVGLEEVIERFQLIYRGEGDRPGRRERESLLVPRDVLRRWAERLPLAIVTGRPRDEAEWFIDRFDLQPLFGSLITRDDAPTKPSPEPIRRALAELGVARGWFLGDSADDLRAGVAARLPTIGVTPPGTDPAVHSRALVELGAAAVLDRTIDLEELLP